MPSRIALSIAFLIPAAAPLPSADIEIHKVFGPEIPGKYKHPASIAQLKGGDLFIVYHGGAGEYEDDTAVWGTRLKAGETRWDAPRPIADTPFHGDGNAVIWQAPDGVAWLLYVVRYGATWSGSRILAKVSRDGARTWSDSFVLAFEAGMMVRNAPIVLSSGDYLLPVYHEVGDDPEQVSKECTSLFLRYQVKEKRWSETNRIRSHRGNIQPAPAQITDDHLVCYARRGGDYQPTADGWLVRSESRDGGKTWAAGTDSKFPNPNAAVELLKLKNGHLMLIYNDSMVDRTPLAAAVSTDGDKSYPFRRNIAEGKDDFAYPFAIQAEDGKIHLVFTSHERTVIEHAVFDESAITGGAAR